MKKLKIRLVCECLLGIAIASFSVSVAITYEGPTGQLIVIIFVFIYALLSAIVSILETYKKVLEEELKEKRVG